MSWHDNAYKNLFSHPQAVRDLLRGFVEEDWVALLDFDTLEKVSGSYVSDDLRDREDDIIWRIRVRGAENDGDVDQQGEWVYVYLLLEFQSSVDAFMAVRILTYIGLLYQELIKSGQIRAKPRKIRNYGVHLRFGSTASCCGALTPRAICPKHKTYRRCST